MTPLAWHIAIGILIGGGLALVPLAIVTGLMLRACRERDDALGAFDRLAEMHRRLGEANSQLMTERADLWAENAELRDRAQQRALTDSIGVLRVLQGYVAEGPASRRLAN